MAAFSIPPAAKLGNGFNPQFSPGGNYLLVHQNSASAKVFSVANWQLTGKLDGAPSPRLADFGPKDETVDVATISGPIVRFALPSCKKQNRWLIRATTDPNGFVVHPESDILFHSCCDEHINCLSATTGKVVEQLPIEDAFARCDGIALSSDRSRLASIGRCIVAGDLDRSRMELQAWSLPDRKLAFRVHLDNASGNDWHFGPIVAVPDTALVAVACHNQHVVFVDLRTKKIVRRIEGIGQGGWRSMSLAFSRCGRWAAIGDEGRIRIFDQTLARLYATVEAPEEDIYGLDISADGRFFVAATTATFVWEVSQIVPSDSSKAPAKKKASTKRAKSPRKGS